VILKKRRCGNYLKEFNEELLLEYMIWTILEIKLDAINAKR
jgi:hypothetical protein